MFDLNLDTRLSKHNQGSTKSTRPYRPWRLAYYEEFSTRTEAIKREYALKKMKSRKYLDSLIEAHC